MVDCWYQGRRPYTQPACIRCLLIRTHYSRRLRVTHPPAHIGICLVPTNSHLPAAASQRSVSVTCTMVCSNATAPASWLLQFSRVTAVAVSPFAAIAPIPRRTRIERCGALCRWRSANWAMSQLSASRHRNGGNRSALLAYRDGSSKTGGCVCLRRRLSRERRHRCILRHLCKVPVVDIAGGAIYNAGLHTVVLHCTGRTFAGSLWRHD